MGRQLYSFNLLSIVCRHTHAGWSAPRDARDAAAGGLLSGDRGACGGQLRAHARALPGGSKFSPGQVRFPLDLQLCLLLLSLLLAAYCRETGAHAEAMRAHFHGISTQQLRPGDAISALVCSACCTSASLGWKTHNLRLMSSTEMTQEENLRAALLLEQAAFCLLHVAPPHVRKFAFHMVLSGLRYNACGQVPLGVRAYR